MHNYVHHLNPVILGIGPIQIRWYGLMYVIGFIVAGQLLKKLTRQNFLRIAETEVDTLVSNMIIGMFLGARFFYVFVYNFESYSNNWLDIFAVWKGGLSFHGALIGLIVSGYLFARKHNLKWFEVMDAVALVSGPGLFCGRIGNFINGELYGRITNSSIGIIFPEGGPFPRHPSQLYEALLEGIILCSLLWLIKSRVKTYGIISASFAFLYGVFRFSIEFFREPDSQLGYYFNMLTMGQILCFLMMLVGVVVYLHSQSTKFKTLIWKT